MMLCDYQVPMLRAAWFIKLSSAYTVAVSEAKIKKRQLPDPSQGKFFMDEFRNYTSISFSCFFLCFFFTYFYFFSNVFSLLEWTSTLIKFMKDQLIRLQEYYQQPGSNSVSLLPSHLSNSASASPNPNSGANTPNPPTGSSTPSSLNGSSGVLNNSLSNLSTNLGQPSPAMSENKSVSEPPPMTDLQKVAQRQWHYCVQLAKYMYEVSLS